MWKDWKEIGKPKMGVGGQNWRKLK